MPAAPQSRDGFRVALFCTRQCEAESVRDVFETCWADKEIRYGKAPGDSNYYTTGTIGDHNVVLVRAAGQDEIGVACAAAGVCASFPGIRLAIVVGTCGVVPVHPTTKRQIALGDVVVGTTVVQCDHEWQAAGDLDGKYKLMVNEDKFSESLQRLVQSKEYQQALPAATDPASDVYQPRPHVPYKECLPGLGTRPWDRVELGHEDDKLVPRVRHDSTATVIGAEEAQGPRVHVGRFGSAHTAMRSATYRDRISAGHEVTAFEVGGAVVRQRFPAVLIIKAACEYSDGHFREGWLAYAAAMAAAGLKIFLREWLTASQLENLEASTFG